ncbi:MAG: toll/interleukin-1 receptor domain-containing protein [Methanobrevibacter sp.]|nr:toll/interleukin-1 receptor domain-containing protein [Methanobrevibacter sp.]
MKKYDFFISHSSQDMELAYEICNYIEVNGFSCWIPSKDIIPGNVFEEQIIEAIMSSDYFIALITENSMKSRYCLQEVKFAWDNATSRGLTMIPIRVDNAKVEHFHWAEWVKSSDFQKFFDNLFAEIKYEKKQQITIEKINSLIKLGANKEAAKLIVAITEYKQKKYQGTGEENDFNNLVKIAIKFSDFNYGKETKEEGIKWQNAIDYIFENGRIFEKDYLIKPENSDKLAFNIQIMLKNIYYLNVAPTEKYDEIREKLKEKFPDIKPFSTSIPESKNLVASPDIELYEAAAKYLNESYNMFNILMKRGAGLDFAKCLLTSYERLQSFCEIVGDKTNGTLCIDKIVELKNKIAALEKEDNLSTDSIAENGIKTLLGLKIPESGRYDAFLCHKKEDLDIAKRIY